MTILQDIKEKGHEEVSFFQDAKTGLVAIIGVHSTVLGPSLGGCRVRDYATLEDALYDVLRLSEAMTFKNSLCGINFGGGKSVIVKDATFQEGRKEFFASFGKCVESIGGRYITAEDMGTSVEDMNSIMLSTKYVAGRDPKIGGAGDPSPYTAKGCFLGIQACLEEVFGEAKFSDRHITIQGIGNVGWNLTKLLREVGVKITVADTDAARLTKAKEEFGVEVVAPDKIHTIKCDIFAPCAVGGIINRESVPQLQCRIIAGGANNQLRDREVELLLKERDILYAPDFAINSGGVILVADDFEPGGFTPSRVNERVSKIGETVRRVIREARTTGKLAGDIAVRLAKERIASGK
jgi:leucine dehydrogenase